MLEVPPEGKATPSRGNLGPMQAPWLKVPSQLKASLVILKHWPICFSTTQRGYIGEVVIMGSGEGGSSNCGEVLLLDTHTGMTYPLSQSQLCDLRFAQRVILSLISDTKQEPDNRIKDLPHFAKVAFIRWTAEDDQLATIEERDQCLLAFGTRLLESMADDPDPLELPDTIAHPFALWVEESRTLRLSQLN